MSTDQTADTRKRKRALLGPKETQSQKSSSKKAKLQDTPSQRGFADIDEDNVNSTPRTTSRKPKEVEIVQETPTKKSKDRKQKSDQAEETSLQRSTTRSKSIQQEEEEKASSQTVNGETAVGKSEKNKKRRSLTNGVHTVASGITEVAVDHGGTSKPNGIAVDEGTKSKKKSGKKQKVYNADWHLSHSVGGRFLRRPPLFSADEKYLILADSFSVRIYETATSLLVRKLKGKSRYRISAFALSAANADTLFVATDSGLLIKYNWDDGTEITRWQFDYPILELQVSTDANNLDVLYVVQQEVSETIQNVADNDVPNGIESEKNTAEVLEEGRFSMIAAAVTETSHLDILGTVFTSPLPPQSPFVFSNGQVIVTCTRDAFYIGQRSHELEESLQYTWHDVPVKEEITCLSALWVIPDEGQQPNALKHASLSVTVGCTDGKIFVYQDLLSVLKNYEQSMETYRPILFHWHRRAVGSVQFSRDGNYIISGGQETVLNLWQLDSGKRSHLPHLMSPIENITVSPTGAAYALAFSDNSVIVLSTSDMKPTTNIAGVQSITQSQVQTHTSHIPIRTTAALDPRESGQILIAVPAHSVKAGSSGASAPTPYIQRFDLTSDRHIARQALTRNNATNFMDAPNGEPVDEPTVSLIEISQDGDWLATIDEWTPPSRDVEHASCGEDTVEEQQSIRREIHLKFWRLNTENGVWQLETRIDSPHIAADNTTPCRVLALTSDPHHTGFSTIGEDGRVKIWRPKVRTVEGRVVRGAGVPGTVSWSAQSSIELEHFFLRPSDEDDASEVFPTSACIAFSPDGSILAATQLPRAGPFEGVVHLINVASGTLLQSRAGLYTTEICAMGFISHSLVILSDSLLVWDTINDDLVYSLELPGLLETRGEDVHLAINAVDNTFAVALPDWRDPGRTATQILMCDAKDPKKISTIRAPGGTTAFLAKSREKGYVILNDAAQIRILSPSSMEKLPMVEDVEEIPEEEVEDYALVDALTEAQKDDLQEEVVEKATAVDDDDMLKDSENDKPVIASEKLASTFDTGHSFALPLTKGLVKSMMELYIRKPLQGVA